MTKLIKRNRSLLMALSFLLFGGCTQAPVKSAESTARKPNEASAVNPGAIEISNPEIYSQVVAISDIHGMFNQVVKNLQAGHLIDNKNHWTAGKTLLIITGDSIDKGPQSLDVLDLWIQLQSEASTAGGRLIHTLGNHEAEFFAEPNRDRKAAELSDELIVRHIPVADLSSMQNPRGQFLLMEPLAVKVGAWIFCHAGYYPEMPWNEFTRVAQQVLSTKNYADEFVTGQKSILEAKKWDQKNKGLKSVFRALDQAGAYGVVFGHQPSAFGIDGRSAAVEEGRLIKIDNGMAPEAGSHPGSLLVFTNPKQMSEKSYPSIVIIQADGASSPLRPE